MSNVITNNHQRCFVFYLDVPRIVMKREFSCLVWEQKMDGFIHYMGMWLRQSDFMMLGGDRMIDGRRWDGCSQLTRFGRILIRVSGDGRTYIIGRQVE